MAMSKKEQAERAALIHKVRVMCAFHHTAPVAPDVLPPDSYNGLKVFSKGFVPNIYRLEQNYGHGGISYGISATYGHAVDDDKLPTKTTSQGSIHMFSTMEKALRHARFELEQKYATTLARIDGLIKDEIKNPTPLEK